jgi:hypothetical protein
MQTALFHKQKNAQNAADFMHCQGLKPFSGGGQLILTCRICGILGVYTLELLQQLPLSILDGSVHHIIQTSALVILRRHVKDAIIPHKILDSL